MKEIDPRRERSLALAIWGGLLLYIGLVVTGAVVVGFGGMFVKLPPSEWQDVLIANALFLFVIGWSDYPEIIRKSAILRTQVLCWATLMFLTALLLSASSKRYLEETLGYFIGSLLAVAVYSSGAIYRARRR